MANPNDLERLLAGDKNLEGADLSGVKLTNTDLRGVDFSEADLSGADLSGSDLSKVLLHRTNLRGAKLRKCKFLNRGFENPGHWTLQGADLSGSYFKNLYVESGSADSATNLEGCTFEESYIWEFDGNPRVKANNCTFIEPLTHQRFVNMEMKNCTFKRQLGGDVHFEGADLSGSDFSAVDWTGELGGLERYSDPDVYFEGADLEGVKGIPLPITDHFSHVGETVEEKARRVAEGGARQNGLERLLAGDKNLREADLSGVKLTNADLRGVDFSGADLSGADLSGSDLSKAIFDKTNLRGAKLRKCKFHQGNEENQGYWTLQGADLSGSYFKDMFVEWGSADSKTNLEGCTFEECYIWDFKGYPRVKANNCTFIKTEPHNRFINWEMKNCTFKTWLGGDTHFEGADLSGSDFSAVDWTDELSYVTYSKSDVYFEGADLEGVKGIPLPITDQFSHKGETVEEKARRVAEAHKKREEEARKKREEEEARKKREEEEARKKREEEARKKREEEEARKKREEEEARKKREEERIRRKTIQDVTKRVSRTRLDDKNLEDLAQEVGSLQAQPEYVKEYGKVLEELQEKIENNYSLLGKGIRNIKRIFRRFRRASQIRTASQMLNQLNKEIADLKKEL